MFTNIPLKEVTEFPEWYIQRFPTTQPAVLTMMERFNTGDFKLMVRGHIFHWKDVRVFAKVEAGNKLFTFQFSVVNICYFSPRQTWGGH